MWSRRLSAPHWPAHVPMRRPDFTEPSTAANANRPRVHPQVRPGISYKRLLEESDQRDVVRYVVSVPVKFTHYKAVYALITVHSRGSSLESYAYGFVLT